MKRLQSFVLALAVALLLPMSTWAQETDDGAEAESSPAATTDEAEASQPEDQGTSQAEDAAESSEVAQADPGEETPAEEQLEGDPAEEQLEGDPAEEVIEEDPALEAGEAETAAEIQGEIPVEEEAEEPVFATEAPEPPTDVRGEDAPNDAGESVILHWEPSANEAEAGIVRYAIMRAESREGPFEEIKSATAGSSRFRDSSGIVKDQEYYYKVVAVSADGREAESEVVSVVAEAQWFHRGRTFILVLAILLAAAILFNIDRARRGVDLYVRRIAGLESVEEAIGRSTEMGKPVLYVPGIRDMDDIQTIASMSILAHVAKLTAEYDTPILVPNIRAVVMSTAQEVVKQAYLDAGRPDAYNPENIRYLTDDQFGYVAGVDGIMMRDKPAANFFLGCFFAESLILAETGASTGAIQIAGTAMPSQLPFFVAACDYTLIGQ
ncbi:MAG: DUF6754 domain-containing protein, partial [Myxococcota bacterium]